MELGRTHKRWVEHMKKCALEVGIPDSNRMVIMYLYRNPGANQKRIAEFSDKTTAAINQTVKEMTLNGYVRVETDTEDQRYTKLYLTEKGMEKAKLLHERLRRSDEVITSKISKEKETHMGLLHWVASQ